VTSQAHLSPDALPDAPLPLIDGARWRLGEELPVELEPWRMESRLATPDSVFESRYSQMDTARLVADQRRLEEEWRTQGKTLLQTRFDNGQYLRREVDMEIDLDGDGSPDEKPGFQFTSEDQHPMTQARTIGTEAVHIAWLSFVDYPDFYMTLDELRWLRAELRRRSQE
jgi:hypothetical protein